MYNSLFQRLSSSELEAYAVELEQAIENHARWMAQVNRVLVCKLPPDENDLAEEPDQLCKFGHWYHGIDNPVLTTLESFRAIDPVHRQVHETARQLLLSGTDSDDTPRLYDQLFTLAEELRIRLNTLLGELNQNRKLTSRLMSKVFENAGEGRQRRLYPRHRLHRGGGAGAEALPAPFRQAGQDLLCPYVARDWKLRPVAGRDLEPQEGW
jgi:hypothetical protein